MSDWAVKYRPKHLEEIVGQKVNIELLQDKISSPYASMIFYGSSGCGKTTTARALATDLGAELIELDAASNNSVDDVRELLDYVGKKSISGGHKVFVIDEAHALSRQAWQAMLKSIEEPPKKVVFIFCTTEYKALPQTILGRAQLFKFYPLREEDLMELYQRVAKEEGLDFEESLVKEIIARTKNQARDFLKLLQKVKDAGISQVQELDKLTSTPPIAMAGAYLQGVLKGDSGLAISALKKIKTPLIEWKDRIISLIYETQEDRYGISELRYPLPQAQKLRNLAEEFPPKLFGHVLTVLISIKREEEAYAILFALALRGVDCG